MSLDKAAEDFAAMLAEFRPGTSLAPAPGSTGHFEMRAYALGYAFLTRCVALGIESDLAAVERLYRAGSAYFGKAVVPEEVTVQKEVLTPEQQVAVDAAIASGNLATSP